MKYNCIVLVSEYNCTLSIPHRCRKKKNSSFPAGCADSAAEDGRHGSNVYEVNMWLWQFGCGKACLGPGWPDKEETSERQDSACKEFDKYLKDTPQDHKGDLA